MANDLLATPIRVDTAFGAVNSGWKAAVLATLGQFLTLRVEKVYWENPLSTPAQTLTIIDPITSKVLLNATTLAAAAVPSSTSQLFDWTPSPRLWQDFRVSVISSGVCWIYAKAG